MTDYTIIEKTGGNNHWEGRYASLDEARKHARAIAAEYGKPCSIVYKDGRSVISCEATDTPQDAESWQLCKVRYTIIDTVKRRGENTVAEHAAPTLAIARADARGLADAAGNPCAILYAGIDNAPILVDLNDTGSWRELKTK